MGLNTPDRTPEDIVNAALSIKTSVPFYALESISEALYGLATNQNGKSGVQVVNEEGNLIEVDTEKLLEIFDDGRLAQIKWKNKDQQTFSASFYLWKTKPGEVSKKGSRYDSPFFTLTATAKYGNERHKTWVFSSK
jgi:hypothetical protein